MSAIAVTGPRDSGKTSYLHDLERACAPPVYWLMPAMELSTVDAQALGAHQDTGIFLWPSEAPAGTVLVDEPDRAMDWAQRYVDILSFLKSRGHNLFVATHTKDVVAWCDDLHVIRSGGITDRESASTLVRIMLSGKRDPISLSSPELVDEWGGWPFLDVRQGAGALFEVVPPGLEMVVAWVLVDPVVHEAVMRGRNKGSEGSTGGGR